MAIQKIGFTYPQGSLMTQYDHTQVTLLELGAITAAKVDECVDTVNGVEQSAIDARAIVDEMEAEQATISAQFQTAINTVSATMQTNADNAVASISADMQTDADTAVTGITAGANTRIDNAAIGRVNALVTDGTIKDTIGAALFSDMQADIDTNLATFNTHAGNNSRHKMNILDFGAHSITETGHETFESTSAIQAAIDSLGTAGGVVYFPCGTYLTAKLTLKPNVSLVSEKATLKAKTGQNYIISAVQGDNTEVIGFIFDCAGLTDAGGDAGIASAAIYYPVGGLSYKNVHIENNRFNNIPKTNGNYHAIGMNYADCFVRDNYIPQCGGDALNFNSGYNVVTGNTIYDGGDGAIAFNNGACGTIIGNIIHKCSLGVGCGPELTLAETENLYRHQLVISSNQITGCYIGINLGWFESGRGPTNVVVMGNSVRDCNVAGIRYDGHDISFQPSITIIGNDVEGTGSDLWSGTFNTTAIDIGIFNCGLAAITGNVCSKSKASVTRYGIVVNTSNNVNITGNIVQALDSAGSYEVAIDVIDSPYTTVASNNILLAKTGVLLTDAGLGRARNVVVDGNFILEYSVAGVRVLGTASKFRIINNTIETTTAGKWGIDLSAACTIFDVMQNFFDVPDNGIILNGPGTANFYRIENNTMYGAAVTNGQTGSTSRVQDNF